MVLPTPLDPARGPPPSRMEHLLVLTADVFLAEAIASAANVAGFRNVETASTICDLVNRPSQSRPALLLTTLEASADQSFELLRLVHDHSPATKVVLIVEEASDPELAVAALINGVAGLALRQQGLSSLLRVVELVLAGELVVPRWLTEQMVRSLRTRPGRPPQNVQLSARQQEVLRLIARGATDRQISEALNISLTTVRSHLAAIFDKTGTANRTSAAIWASVYLVDSDD